MVEDGSSRISRLAREFAGLVMRRSVDPEAGMREFVELWSTNSADDLHRVLVLHPIVRRSADAFEPYGLLVKHHEAEPDSSIVTALLLLTDPRWRDGVSHLVRRIEDEGVLDTGALDLLARTFLSADKVLYWKVPDRLARLLWLALTRSSPKENTAP